MNLKQRILDAGYSLHIILELDEACVTISRGNTVVVPPKYAESEELALFLAYEALRGTNATDD